MHGGFSKPFCPMKNTSKEIFRFCKARNDKKSHIKMPAMLIPPWRNSLFFFLSIRRIIPSKSDERKSRHFRCSENDLSWKKVPIQLCGYGSRPSRTGSKVFGVSQEF